MPRARLGTGSWRLEDDALADLRRKIVGDRKTLGEVYGQPLYGIKTGLNDAFVIDRATRDRLVAADPKSAELLKPFLRGENIKRWRVESDDLWLINTPKGKADIEQYPAIRNWLLPFKAELEKRATKQEWWELQQARLAYQEVFSNNKIVFPDMSQGANFCIDASQSFCGNTIYLIDSSDLVLLAILNSKVAWSFLFGQAEALRGGEWRLRLFSQNIIRIPIPDFDCATAQSLRELAGDCSKVAQERLAIQSSVRHRMLDLAPPELRKLTGKLENFHQLDFKSFRDEIKKAFRADIPVEQRGE
jgi:hypothetical protein